MTPHPYRRRVVEEWFEPGPDGPPDVEDLNETLGDPDDDLDDDHDLGDPES